MRTSQLLTALFALAFLFTPALSHADTALVVPQSQQGFFEKMADGQQSLVSKLAEKKIAKRLAKKMKALKNVGGLDFKSEPDRWLLYAIISWVIGAAFYFLWVLSTFGYFLAFFGWLFWALGGLLFLYWIYKKFLEKEL
jgi:hypothetical protein